MAFSDQDFSDFLLEIYFNVYSLMSHLYYNLVSGDLPGNLLLLFFKKYFYVNKCFGFLLTSHKYKNSLAWDKLLNLNYITIAKYIMLKFQYMHNSQLDLIDFL